MSDTDEDDDVQVTNVLDPDGVRVLAERCSTCIFRPGNPMHLNTGRVAEMVTACLVEDGHIVCHKTLDLPKQAVCRGFWDSYADRVTIGQLAHRLNFLKAVRL